MTHYRSPEDLIRELGITKPQDIDIEAIAYYCNAKVLYLPLEGCAARIIGTTDKAIISVDEASSRPRQRFSVGHELGHWMRDRGKATFLCQNQDLRRPWDYRSNPESQANEYAAHLLMPSFIFKPAAQNHDITFRTVGELADLFVMSNTATAIRLVEFGSYPAIIALYSTTGRKWFKRSRDVPDSFWPVDELSHNTQAFDMLFGDLISNRPMLSDAGDWIKRRDADRYTIIEDSIKVTDDSVLVLLWWKDESQISDALGW